MLIFLYIRGLQILDLWQMKNIRTKCCVIRRLSVHVGVLSRRNNFTVRYFSCYFYLFCLLRLLFLFCCLLNHMLTLKWLSVWKSFWGTLLHGFSKNEFSRETVKPWFLYWFLRLSHIFHDFSLKFIKWFRRYKDICLQF